MLGNSPFVSGAVEEVPFGGQEPQQVPVPGCLPLAAEAAEVLAVEVRVLGQQRLEMRSQKRQTEPMELQRTFDRSVSAADKLLLHDHAAGLPGQLGRVQQLLLHCQSRSASESSDLAVLRCEVGVAIRSPLASLLVVGLL